MPRPRREPPRAFAENWPEQPVGDSTAEAARLVAMRLRQAIAGRPLRQVEAITGVHNTTIGVVLRGDAWPDIFTLAKLELGLGVDLWPVRSGVVVRRRSDGGD